MRKMEKNRVFIFIVLLSVIWSGCSKSEVPSGEADWSEQHGLAQDSTLTLETEKPLETKKPTGFDISSIELPFPTPLPVREFVPQEGQVELVLWMNGVHEQYLDDHMVAELNHLLQGRGCSFYLTKRVESKSTAMAQISRWQEVLDSGETVDLIYFGREDDGLAYKEYGDTAIIRAISGGYLLPFSDYPETEAKERLLAAYPEHYWRLCSFQGENYGVSNSVSDYYIKRKDCLMLNLDAAKQAGIEIPEELDILNLDKLLGQAEEAGILGVGSMDELSYCGIEPLFSGLYVKFLQKGKYRIVNPLEDEELLTLWDSLYRYKERGWGEKNSVLTGEFPLIMFETVTDENWDGEQFCLKSEKGDISARVKIYDEKERFLVEGNYNQLLGISSFSQHKEEALELLSLMHGDEEIVQLLRYGIEGVHYCIGGGGLENVETSELIVSENGYSIGGKKWSSPKDYSFGNHLMYVGLEAQLGKENREEEVYAAITDIELVPYLEDFSDEQKIVRDKIKDITYIAGKNSIGVSIENKMPYLIILNEEYKSDIEELRAAFAEVGYNELAKAVNKKHGLE